MGLETGSTISALDSSWPLAGDFVSTSDDHIRLLKAVLKATFPGAGGSGFTIPITAKEAELNRLVGLTRNVEQALAIHDLQDITTGGPYILPIGKTGFISFSLANSAVANVTIDPTIDAIYEINSIGTFFPIGFSGAAGRPACSIVPTYLFSAPTTMGTFMKFVQESGTVSGGIFTPTHPFDDEAWLCMDVISPSVLKTRLSIQGNSGCNFFSEFVQHDGTSIASKSGTVSVGSVSRITNLGTIKFAAVSTGKIFIKRIA